MSIKIGDSVIMPEPDETDSYRFGGFVATVTGIRENGNLIVADADNDAFEIEPERVRLDEAASLSASASAENPSPYGQTLPLKRTIKAVECWNSNKGATADLPEGMFITVEHAYDATQTTVQAATSGGLSKADEKIRKGPLTLSDGSDGYRFIVPNKVLGEALGVEMPEVTRDIVGEIIEAETLAEPEPSATVKFHKEDLMLIIEIASKVLKAQQDGEDMSVSAILDDLSISDEHAAELYAAFMVYAYTDAEDMDELAASNRKGVKP